MNFPPGLFEHSGWPVRIISTLSSAREGPCVSFRPFRAPETGRARILRRFATVKRPKSFTCQQCFPTGPPKAQIQRWKLGCGYPSGSASDNALDFNKGLTSPPLSARLRRSQAAGDHAGEPSNGPGEREAHPSQSPKEHELQ